MINQQSSCELRTKKITKCSSLHIIEERHTDTTSDITPPICIISYSQHQQYRRPSSRET